MIAVTRLNGTEMYLNPNLILSVESTPDTVITFTSGEKLLVKDTAQALAQQFTAYQRMVHGASPVAEAD